MSAVPQHWSIGAAALLLGALVCAGCKDDTPAPVPARAPLDVKIGKSDAGPAAPVAPAPKEAVEAAPAPVGEIFKVPLGDAPRRGPDDALVTIVQYADFEDPFSARVQPTLEALLEAHPKDLRVVFKQNPMPFHTQAPTAAEAALSAHKQGGFFKLSKLLFGNRQALDVESILGYATRAGLDGGAIRRDLETRTLRRAVELERAEAEAFGAEISPTFFINGEKLAGAHERATFDAIIARQRARAQEAVTAGVPRSEVYDHLVASGRTRSINVGALDEAKAVAYVDVGDAPSLGPEDADVTAVLFCDIQASFCAHVFKTLGKLRKRYAKKLRIVYRHLPLEFNENAHLAAQAAHAAHVQGDFWKLIERLFAHQGALGQAQLVEHAKAVGLDAERLAQELRTGKHRSAVDSDLALARRLGLSGAPSLFLNGRFFGGAQPEKRLAAAIDAQLPATAELRRRGITGQELYAAAVEGNRLARELRKIQEDLPRRYALERGDSPFLGPDDAPVSLFVFTDFTCTFCKGAISIIEKLRGRYGDKLRVVFKHFPARHSALSAGAHRAAQAAWEMGAFWDYYRLLYAQQPRFKTQDLQMYANHLALDVRKFTDAMNSKRVAELVRGDVALGKEVEILATPEFFVNGTRVTGAQPVEYFVEHIEAELKRAAKPK